MRRSASMSEHPLSSPGCTQKRWLFEPFRPLDETCRGVHDGITESRRSPISAFNPKHITPIRQPFGLQGAHEATGKSEVSTWLKTIRDKSQKMLRRALASGRESNSHICEAADVNTGQNLRIAFAWRRKRNCTGRHAADDVITGCILAEKASVRAADLQGISSAAARACKLQVVVEAVG